MVLRILHLEDEPLDTAIVLRLLKKDGLHAEIDRLDTFAEYRQALSHQDRYSLILSDYSMPEIDPHEALKMARQTRPELPFVFLTGTIGEETAIEMVKLGANDYVLKQRIQRLPQAVRRALREAEEQALRRQAEHDLRRAKEAAEEASRAKDIFLVNMSHELRTPLTVNMGMLELAKLSGGCDEETSRYLDKASNSADVLLRMIENILELRRLQEKSLPMAEAPFDLVDCCRKALNQLIPPAEKKGLQCTMHLDSCLPGQVIGDCAKVEEILLHLIGNAVKFTEQGRIEVSIRPAGGSDDGREQVRFEIRDTGIGIPTDKLHSIFQPFSQADASLTRRYGGAGLGLAISRELIEQLGGEMEVQSRPGGGSIFSFLLPFAVTTEESQPAPAQQQQTGRASAGQGARILVVEDDASVAQMLQMILTQGGYQVKMAEHGQRALQVLEQEAIDLILMDLKMPVMDGYDATRSIRQREQWRQIPIIALTAHARPEDKAHCLATGMNDFLTKPINMQQLRTAIEKHLSTSLDADTETYRH